MADPNSTSKTCPRCASAKPPTAFGIDRKRPDGRYPICKQCRSIRAKESHAADPGKARARWRRWADAHPEQLKREREANYAANRDEVKARSRAWYWAHHVAATAGAKARYLLDRERRLAAASRKRREHPETRWEVRHRERALNRQRQWNIKNPEKRRATQQRSRLARFSGERRTVSLLQKCISEFNRRAKKRGAFIEVVEPLVVYERDGGVCGICARQIAKGHQWHVDHIVPIAKGGVHSYANVQLAHALCNSKKGATIPAGQIGLFQKKAV